MVTAQEELGLIRPQIVEAIDRLRRDGLSTMDAYDALGRQIGKSSRWVRKIIGRDESAEVRLRDALNIAAAYARLCAGIDAVSDAIEADTIRMREARFAREAETARTHDPRLVPGEDQERSS